MSAALHPDDVFAPVLCTGICGSGKTYTLQTKAAEAAAEGRHRVLVLDTGHQWPGEPLRQTTPVVRYTIVRTAAGARRALDAGVGYVVARLERTRDGKGPPLRPAAEELARVALEAGDVVLILPEVHLSQPNTGGSLSPCVGELVHEYRHRRAGVWGDTQHLRDLHTELRDAARLLCVHATDSKRDFRTLRDEYADELDPAIHEALRRKVAGEPGWRVELVRGFREPPFELVR